MQNCPACGRTAPDGAGFCPYCDTALYGIKRSKKKNSNGKPVQATPPKSGWENFKIKAVRFLRMRNSKIFSTGKTPSILRLVQVVAGVPLAIMVLLATYWIYFTTVYSRIQAFAFDIFGVAQWSNLTPEGMRRLLYLVTYFVLMAAALQAWLFIAVLYRQKLVRVLCLASTGVFLVFLVAAAILSAPFWVHLLLALGLLCPLAIYLWLWWAPRARKVFSLQPFKQKAHRPSPFRIRNTAVATAVLCAVFVIVSVFGGVLTEIYARDNMVIVPGKVLSWPGEQGAGPNQEVREGVPYSQFVPADNLMPTMHEQWGDVEVTEESKNLYVSMQAGQAALLAYSNGNSYTINNARVVQQQRNKAGSDLYILLHNGAQYTELYRIQKGLAPQLLAAHVGQIKLSADGSTLYFSAYDPEQGSVWMCMYNTITGEERRVIDIEFLGPNVLVDGEEGWPALSAGAVTGKGDFAVSPNGECVLFNSSYGILLYQRTDKSVKQLGDVQIPAAVSNNGRMVAWYNEERKAYTLVMYGEEKQQIEIAADLENRPGPALYTNADASQFLFCADKGVVIYKNTGAMLYAETGPVGIVGSYYMQAVQTTQCGVQQQQNTPVAVYTSATSLQTVYYTPGGNTSPEGANVYYEDGLYSVSLDQQTPKQIAEGEGTVSVSADGSLLTLLDEEGDLLRLDVSENGQMSSKKLDSDVWAFSASQSGQTTYYLVNSGNTASAGGDTYIVYHLMQADYRGRQTVLDKECIAQNPTDLYVAPNGDSCQYYACDESGEISYRYWLLGENSRVLFGEVPQTGCIQLDGVVYDEVEMNSAFFNVDTGAEQALYFYNNGKITKVT